MSKSNALLQARSAIGVEQSNIAKSRSTGSRGSEFIISSSSVNGQVSYTTGTTRQDITKRGAVIYTGAETDISINDSSSMFVIKDQMGKSAAFTRSGSFRVDQEKKLVDPLGNVLQGWKLQNGNLPTNNSSFDSLQPIKIEDGVSQPKATSKVTMRINLNANQDAIKGTGATMKIGGENNKGLKENDIISPFSSGRGYNELNCDDTIKAVVAGEVDKTYEYRFGGVTYSHAIKTKEIFGVKNPSDSFVFSADRVGNANALVSGDGIQVNVGGKSFSFTAQNNGDSKQNQFRNLYTLRDTMNNTGYLRATIKPDGVLCIGSAKPNEEVTFANQNGGCIVEQLGIANIPANNPDVTGVERYNSLQTLQEAVKSSSEGNLTTEIINGAINIRAAVATDGLALTCNPTENRLVEAVPTLGTGNVAGRATITLQSTAHGLKKGDYVWLDTMGGVHENGMYMVTSAPTPNHFTVGVWTGANFAAGNAKADIAAAATWRKVPGAGAGATTTVPAGAATQLTTEGNGANFTIASVGVGAGLAEHDLVYVQGMAAAKVQPIPDGFYVITASNADDITCTQVGGGVIAGVAAAAAAAAAAPVTVQKVGVSNAGALIGNGINADRPVLRTLVNTKIARFHVQPGHNYNVGERVNVIVDDTNPDITADNLVIATGLANNYTVSAVGADWVDFNVPNSVAVAGASNDHIFNADFGGGAGARSAVRLHFPDRAYGSLGVTAEEINNLEATYQDNEDKSLGEQAGSEVSNFSFIVVDQLGNEHSLNIRMGYIGNKKWAYEIVAPKGEVKPKDDRTDGVVKAGYIEFDPDGNIYTLGDVLDQINLTWENGSSNSFSLDLDQDGKITQLAADSAIYSMEHDGATVGNLENVQIDRNGNVVFLYSNGKQEKIFKVALANFVNPNGLQESSNGAFVATKDSGYATLRSAGEAGVGEVQSQVIEGSAIEDMTDALLGVQDWNIYYQANAKIISQDNEMKEYLISVI